MQEHRASLWDGPGQLGGESGEGRKWRTDKRWTAKDGADVDGRALDRLAHIISEVLPASPERRPRFLMGRACPWVLKALELSPGPGSFACHYGVSDSPQVESVAIAMVPDSTFNLLQGPAHARQVPREW